MLSSILKLDAKISRILLMRDALVSPTVRFGFLLIEWAAHGIPWLIVSGFGTLYVIRKQYPQRLQWKWCVLLFGILLDLAAVGLFKISFQRNRPPYNEDDQVYEAPIADKFSFPSGHSSRAVMLTVLGLHLLTPLNFQTKVLLYIFPVILGFTRVAMGRHYFFDVLAGIGYNLTVSKSMMTILGFALGYFEGIIALQLPHEIPNLLSNYIPIIFVE